MPDADMPEGQMRLMPLTPPAPQRIPGRLRSQGPLSQADVLLEPMDPSELEAWESSPLPTEPPER